MGAEFMMGGIDEVGSAVCLDSIARAGGNVGEEAVQMLED